MLAGTVHIRRRMAGGHGYKTSLRNSIAAGGLVLMIWLCNGCSGIVVSPTTASQPPPGVLLVLSPANASVLLGNTVTMSVKVSNTTNMGIEWSVDNVPGGNTTVGTIVAVPGLPTTAIFTAPQSLPASPAVTIEATSVADPTKTITASVDITSDVSVSFSPATATMELGSQQTFQAGVTSAGNPITSVTWKTEGPGCSGVGCGTVTSAGLFTAPQILPSPPTVVLIATSFADPSKSATVTIAVTSHFTLAISASGSIGSGIAAGSSVGFVATLSPVPGSNPSTVILWSVSGAGCTGAACGTLVSSGSSAAVTYAAPAIAPPPAQVTITATAVADPSKTASLTLSI